jgi:hypothetical protein
MVELFFCENGALNCSIVGATFCRDREVVDVMFLLMEDLKNGVAGLFDFAHAEHIQLALLLPNVLDIRGIVFIVGVVLLYQ